MTQHLSLEANYTGTLQTLYDANVVTGIRLQPGFQLPDLDRAFQYTSQVDSLVRRPTALTINGRELVLPLYATGQGATATLRQTSVWSMLEQLYRVCDEVSAYGGTLYYRPSLSSVTMRFDVVSATVKGAHDKTADVFQRAAPQLVLEVLPYASAGPLELVDSFDYNTMGTAGRFNRGGSDWTADAGALTNMTIVGGALGAATNYSTMNVVRHTGQPTLTADQGAEMMFTTGASVAAFMGGVCPKMVDASNRIECVLEGTTNVLRINKVVAGVRTSLATAAVTPVVNTSYWVDAVIADNTITAYVYSARPAINRSATSLATVTTTLSTADAAVLGKGIAGSVGFVWAPIVFGAVGDDFRRIPHEYSTNGASEIPLGGSGSWGGTTDARFAVTISVLGAASTWAWALIAWWRTPAAWNLVANGNFEGTAGVTGWSTAIVSGIQAAAATSILTTTTSGKVRSGTTAAEVITPATTDSGASYLIARRFRAGVQYSFTFSVKSAGGSTTAYVAKFGVSGSLNTSTPTALTTSWQTLTMTWTPTATVEAAYIAIVTGAATATTFQIDDMQVYEGTTPPAYTPGGVGFGIAGAANAVGLGSAMSVAALTNARSGWGVVSTSSVALATTHFIDVNVLTHALVPDDFAAGEVDVVVYAKLRLDSTSTSLTSYLSVLPGSATYGPTRYADTGSLGKSLTLPSSTTTWRLYKVGTVTFKVDTKRPGRERLRLAFASSGAGVIGIGDLYLVPATQFASSMDGVAQDSSYDTFITSTATTQLARRVDWDQSGWTREDVAQTGLADSMDAVARVSRLGPARLLAPRATGGTTLLFLPFDNVCDRADSSAATSVEGRAYTLRVSPEPMYELIPSGT